MQQFSLPMDIRKYLISAVLAFGLVSMVQAGDRRWDVYLAYGQKIPKVRLQELRGDTIIVTGNRIDTVLAVQDITHLEYLKERKFSPGGPLGFLAGAGLGVLVDHLESKSNRTGPKPENRWVVYGLVGAGTGAIIGTLLGRDRTPTAYPLTDLSLPDKLIVLNAVMDRGEQPPTMAAIMPQLHLGQKLVVQEAKPTQRSIPPEQQPSMPAKSAGDQPGEFFFRTTAGLAFPSGDFGNTSPSAGGAQLGYCINADVGYHFSPTAALLIGATVTRNPVDPGVLGPLASYNPQIEPWWLLWPMVGFQGRLQHDEKTDLFVTGQIGFVTGESPQVNVTVNNTPFRQNAATGTALAFKAGFGLAIHDHMHLMLTYLTGKPEYAISASGGGQYVSQTTVQPINIFLASVGWKF